MEVSHPYTRHPELVSGSSFPPRRSKRLEAQSHRQIDPIRVVALDQIELPLTMPTLQLFFPQDRALHVAEHLVADEAVDLLAPGEPAGDALAVLPKALFEVGGYADVKRTARLAGEDIDARMALYRHGAVPAEKWTLKQVQGDEDTGTGSLARHAELVSASIEPNTPERCK
jgi:hypothetical protein